MATPSAEVKSFAHRGNDRWAGRHDELRVAHVHRLLFIEVPEPKVGKNRVHLDLRPRELTRDAEVERLAGLGATVVADLRDIHGPGIGWVTMADPEGNEFCVLRSERERAAH